MQSELFRISNQIYQVYSNLATVKRTIDLKTTNASESTVEHTFHLVLTCMGVCSHLGMGHSTTLRILKLAAIHDLHEFISGDMCSISGHSDSDKLDYEQKESEAIDKLGFDFIDFWPELPDLLSEYHRQDSFPSRFVNALDKIIPFFVDLDSEMRNTKSKGVSYDSLKSNRTLAIENAPEELKCLMSECLAHAKEYLY